MKAILKANLKVADTLWGKKKKFRKGTEIFVSKSTLLENVYSTKDGQNREYLIHGEFLEITKEEELKVKDNINPQHYKNGTRGIETIDTIIESLGEKGFVNYCIGNVIKYVSRYEYKNGLEDLKKAKWYSEIIIKKLFGDNIELEHCIFEKEEHVLNVLKGEQIKGYLKGSIISKCNFDTVEEITVREILNHLNLLIKENEDE